MIGRQTVGNEVRTQAFEQDDRLTLADHLSRASEDAELRPFHIDLDESNGHPGRDNVVQPLASRRDRRRFTRRSPAPAETAEGAFTGKEKKLDTGILVTQGDLVNLDPREIPSQPGRLVRDWFYGNVVTHRR
jgi:hypothetical protein